MPCLQKSRNRMDLLSPSFFMYSIVPSSTLLNLSVLLYPSVYENNHNLPEGSFLNLQKVKQSSTCLVNGHGNE